MLFLTLTYLTAFLLGLRILAVFNEFYFYKKRLSELISNQGVSIPVLYSNNFILKFQDKTCLENIIFASKSLNNLSPSTFNTWFSFSSDQHNYKISSSKQGNLMEFFYRTNRYGKYSITVGVFESWNKIQKQL